MQGVTAPESDTVLSDALGAAGVYVGLTRGRDANRLHVVAADLDDARTQFVAALARDRDDRGLEEATARAKAAVAGLVADGPVAVVNTERARLATRIAHAEMQASQLEDALTALADQARQQQAERDAQNPLVDAADRIAAETRAEAAAPLTQQAVADGAAYLAARDRVREASRAQAASRGLRRRPAARALADAEAVLRDTEAVAQSYASDLPRTPADLPEWAQTAAAHQAEADPSVIEAQQSADQARAERQHRIDQQLRSAASLRQRTLGSATPSGIAAHAAALRERADHDRRELAELEALPPAAGAKLVQARAAQQQARREAEARLEAQRQARAAQLHDTTRRTRDAGRTPPDRGIGR